jgi:hypothetical protein
MVRLWREALTASRAYKKHREKYDGEVEDREWGDTDSEEREQIDVDMQLDEASQPLLATLQEVCNVVVV